MYRFPKKNAAYIFYTSLNTQTAGNNIEQANPTLAAGDVKVSIDGGTLNNLATLPAVTPALGKAIKVDLSAAEMNGNNIVIVFSDVAGAEWRDKVITLQTSSQTIDETNTIISALTTSLATANTALTAIKTKTDQLVFTIANKVDAALVNAASLAQAAADLVWSTSARTLTAFGFTVTAATVSDKTGYALSTAGILAIWHQLTAAIVTASTIGKLLVDNVNAPIGTLNTTVNVMAASIAANRIKVNTALNNFTFFLALADGVTAATGKTVTAQVSINGAALTTCANAVSEISNGLYKINLAAADLNGVVLTFVFSAALCKSTIITVITQPA